MGSLNSSANYKPDDETLQLLRTRLNAMNAGQDPNAAMLAQDADFTAPSASPAASPSSAPAPNASILPATPWQSLMQQMHSAQPAPTPEGDAQVVYKGNGITGPTLRVPTTQTTVTAPVTKSETHLAMPAVADAPTATTDRILGNYLQGQSASYQADQKAIQEQTDRANTFFARPQPPNYLPLMAMIDRMSYDPLSPNKPQSNLAEQYMKSGYMPMSPEQRQELQLKIMNELSSQRGKIAGLDPKYLALMLNRGGNLQQTSTTSPQVKQVTGQKVVTPPQVGAEITSSTERDARNKAETISSELEDMKSNLQNLDQALAKNDYQTTGVILGQLVRGIGGENRVSETAVVRSLPDNYEKSFAGLESFLSKANTAEFPPGFNGNLQALVRQTEQNVADKYTAMTNTASNSFKKSRSAQGVDVDGIFKPLYDSIGEMRTRGQKEVNAVVARPSRAQFAPGSIGDQQYGDALTQFIKTHQGKK